jgi:gas vesicle protein
MSQQDNFSGGFVLGALIGGAVGALVGVVLASPKEERDRASRREVSSVPKPRKRPLRGLGDPSEQTMEVARQGLEDKIAQLNDAIDEVRHQINGVNGRAPEPSKTQSSESL